MSNKKTKSKRKARRLRRTKYLAVLVVLLSIGLGFGAVLGGWRNLPVIRNLVSPVPRAVPPLQPPTIPSPANPSREYIYSGSKLIAIETPKSDQTITFNSLADKTYGDAPFSLNATASSGLAISFTVTSGPATVSGTTLTITGAGTVSVRADQPGNDSFNPAQSVTQSFNVAKANATVTLTNLNQTYDGAAHYASATTTPSNLSVNFSYSQSGTNVSTPTNAGSYSTVATVADSNYQGSATGTLTIAKATQIITFSALADKTYGDAPFNVSASSSSSLPVSFSIVSGPATVAGSTVTITGAGNVIVRASQAGDSNYNAASDVDRTFNVAKASATITLTNLSQTYDGSAKAATATTNPSGLSGVAITYNGSATAPTNAGSYSVVASLTNANYQAANASGSLIIAKAAQNITFNALADKIYGDAPFTVSASSSSGLAVSFAIVSGPATISGATVTLTGAGAVTVRASQAGNSNYNAAADVDRSFITNGYTYRRSVTIDHTKVPNTDRNNFPVLISGSYSYLKTVANGGNVQNANGYDIIFASNSGCTSKLDHEVETYNSTTGAVNYWVKVPTVSHTSDTTIYLCYGSPNITTDQSNKTAVWDANFKGVWHLPNGISLTAVDSTSNGVNGTITSTAAAGGQIDGCGNFDGTSSKIDMGNASALDGMTALTISAWIKPNSLTGANRIFTKWRGSFLVGTKLGAGDVLRLSVEKSGGGLSIFDSPASTLTTGTWQHLVLTWSQPNTATIYVNGVAKTVTITQDQNVTSTGASSTAVQIGYSSDGLGNHFDGLIDDVRMSNVVRSADWSKTEYNNQSSPATFYTISSVISP